MKNILGRRTKLLTKLWLDSYHGTKMILIYLESLYVAIIIVFQNNLGMLQLSLSSSIKPPPEVRAQAVARHSLDAVGSPMVWPWRHLQSTLADGHPQLARLQACLLHVPWPHQGESRGWLDDLLLV
jgi:hypothetical protein